MTNRNTDNITIPKALIRKKEGVAILPLEEWEKINEYLEEIEERERYFKAFREGRSKKGISLEKFKKKYNL